MKLHANSILEAELFVFDTGFYAKSAKFASGGKYVQSTSSGIASMHAIVEDRPGTYDLAVTYYDETDGVSWSRVLIDGKQVARWSWNEWTGSASAGGDATKVRVIRDVTLDETSRITIEGQSNRGEPLRIDSLQLLRPQSIVNEDDNLAFDGAEGFGGITKGGRGGIVIKVTNLNDSGEGSLRWALEELDFPRIVVFEVGGLIRLSDQINVNGDVTVAGQTAPGGVTITGGRLRVVESDVIIQGLRIRPGDGPGQDPMERDGITIGTSERTVERVILDSNSFTWAVDENISIWSGARDITISNNIIAEGLVKSIHPQGAHSMGLLIGEGAERITISDNLFASNFHRNPQIIDADQIEFVNNVVSNWGNNGFQTAVRDDPVRAHVIGNVFARGDDTSQMSPIRLRGWEEGTKYVVRDNLGQTRSDGDVRSWTIDPDGGRGITHSGTAFKPSNVSVQSSSTAFDHVLANAGARTAGDLDAIDARIVSEVRSGEGSMKDRPKENLKAVVKEGTALRDRDDDGIPDAYEIKVKSDPNRYDPHGDADGDGWLNIDEYFDLLLERDAVGPQASGGGKAVTPPSVQTPNGTARPTDAIVQAEDMRLVSGFEVASNGYANGGRMIQAGNQGEQVASAAFDGADGRYDIVLHYWDENDGRASSQLFLEGERIAAWVWDDGSRSATVNGASAAQYRIRDVDLEEGDEIVLRGFRDGGEPLRVDYIEFDALLG